MLFADVLAERGGSVGTIEVEGAPMAYWLPDGVTLSGIREDLMLAEMIAATDGTEEVAA